MWLINSQQTKISCRINQWFWPLKNFATLANLSSLVETPSVESGLVGAGAVCVAGCNMNQQSGRSAAASWIVNESETSPSPVNKAVA